MPRIPGGQDVGLGEARYARSAETPVLGRPVAQEAGPKQEVTRLEVAQNGVAPLSQFKPVLPGNESEYITRGLDKLEQHAEQFARIQQEEIRAVNEAKDLTDLHVLTGEMKTAYAQSSLDVLNNPELPREEKVKQLQKIEDNYMTTIEATDAKYRPIVSKIVAGDIASFRSHAATVYLQNERDGIKANLDKSYEQIILNAAQSDDLSLAPVDALYGAHKAAGGTDASWVDTRQKIEQTINQNSILGVLKSVEVKSGQPALDAVNDLFTRLTEVDGQGIPKNWARLNPATRNSDIAAVINKKNQIESDMLRGADTIKSQFTEGMKIYSDALKNGDVIPQNLSIDLRNMAQSLGPIALLQLKSVEQQYGPGHRATEMAKDPLFGTGVRPISFQDVSSPEAFQSKLDENIKIGLAVHDAKGLTFVPVLRNADMDGVAKTIEANPVSGIQMIDAMKAALKDKGSAGLMYLAGQMANSKDQAAPAVAAIIYNVAKGDNNTAALIASGMEVIRNKSITMPKEADLRDAFNRQIGDAMAENSANRGISYDAYKTAYASMAARKNVVDGNFDRDSGTEAFKRVVGTVTKWNGSSVLVPDGMDEGKFKDYLNSITPETVLLWGGIHGMSKEKAADFIKDDATLRAISPGRYSVVYEGRQAVTTGGRMFIIDVNTPVLKPQQLEPQLATGAY